MAADRRHIVEMFAEADDMERLGENGGLFVAAAFV